MRCTVRRTSVLLLAAWIAWTAAPSARQARPEVALRAAMDTETVKGDLKGAIEQYRKLAEGTDRAIAATALVRMAASYQRLGDPEARRVFERVVSQFPDQAAAAAEARTRLAALGGAQTADGISERVVVTGRDGNQIDSISRDGRFGLIGDDDTRGRGSLGIRDMATGVVTWRAPFTSDEPEFPEWSPDLEQIAYSFLTDNPGEDAQLRVIQNRPGATPRVLVDSREFIYVVPRGWSSDGTSILASLQRRDKTWQIAWVSVRDGSIKVLRSLGGRLPGPLQPSLSPDGRHIAYAAWVRDASSAEAELFATPRANRAVAADTHVYLMAADGSNEIELVKTAGDNRRPIWMPDGRHILFLSDRSGEVGLWAVSVNEGKPAGVPVLVKANVGQIRPSGITDGGAYHYRSSTHLPAISIARVSPGRLTLPPPSGSTTAEIAGYSPAWSPDGKSIALFRASPRAPASSILVIHSLDTGEERAFTGPGLGLQGGAIWFHDGTRLAVRMAGATAMTPGGSSGAWNVVDQKTGRFAEMLPERTDRRHSGGALSPDDRTLYLVVQTRSGSQLSERIVAIDLATRSERTVFSRPGRPADDGGGTLEFALSPDGRALAVRMFDPQTREAALARIGTDGRDYRDLYKPRQTRGGHWFDWTRDGILFTHLTGADNFERVLMRVSPDDGRVEVASPTFRGVGLQRLSPDGTQIAVGSGVLISELRALDNVLAFLKTVR